MRAWRTPLNFPAPLSSGARVAIVAPSWGGPSVFPHRFEAGLACLRERFGFDLVVMPNATADADWLARNPAARAADLNAAFADRAIDGIIAAIGGDDAIRLEPFLDLGVIGENPKAFVGYSDTTAIHFACLKAGLSSYYGPAVMSGFAENGGISPTTETGFRTMAMARDRTALEWAREGWTDQHLDWSDPANQTVLRTRQPSPGPRTLRGRGTIEGHLIGGCFEVLEMLKATPWWPPLSYWEGAILFLESSEEGPAPDQVKRWVRNYAAQGILDKLGAILLSRPGNLDAKGQGDQEAAVLAALDERGLPQLPVLANLDFGHTDPIVTLPYGATATIACETAQITIHERPEP